MTFIYKYSQLQNNQVISYKKSMSVCSKTKIMKLHLGQLKLFFMELLFLTKYAKKGYTILYVGAADGYHITKLAEIFNECTFDLWDPRKFDVRNLPNINIFEKFFTDDEALNYINTKEKILFMCDMRNMSIGYAKNTNDMYYMDKITDDDMHLQLKWCQLINPECAFLKFRLPYEMPKASYLRGTIILQPYTKISTECRLITSDYINMETYDTTIFNEKIAYHNAYNRCLPKMNNVDYSEWTQIINKYNLYNCWDTILALRITYNYLKECKSIESKEKTGDLFMEIIMFHVEKYGKKYVVLFDNNEFPV
jgi:hypothetical protein